MEEELRETQSRREKVTGELNALKTQLQELKTSLEAQVTLTNDQKMKVHQLYNYTQSRLSLIRTLSYPKPLIFTNVKCPIEIIHGFTNSKIGPILFGLVKVHCM